MEFKQLEKQGIIKPVPFNKDELQAMIKVALNDLQAAKDNLKMLYWDWAHNIAYNAVKQICLALMHAYGYRPAGEAKHKNIFIFAKEVLDSKFHHDIDRADKMRKERNIAMYEASGMINEKKAEANVIFAERFVKEIIEVIQKTAAG